MFLNKKNVIFIFQYLFCFMRFVWNCRTTSQPYFSSTPPAKALALMKGDLNGSQIFGYISFFQNVIFIKIFNYMVNLFLVSFNLLE